MAFSFVCNACLPHQISNIATQHEWRHPTSPDITFLSLGCLGETFHHAPRFHFSRFFKKSENPSEIVKM